MAEAAAKTTEKATPKPSGAVKATVLGKQAKADLPKEIFSEPFHEALVHEAARADLAARRRGTHSSLTRGEVAMTTAKAWRQKGTGRARAGALSVHAERGSVAVLDGSTFAEPATKQAATALQKWGAESPTLVVISSDEEAAAKSFRNIEGVIVALANAAGVADVMGATSLVISEAALEELKARAA